MTSCFVDGCDTQAVKAGLCSKHYQRKRIHGNFEPRKFARGAHAEFMENMLSSEPSDECIIWPFGKNNHGYAMYREAMASRYVCKAVNGDPPTDKHEAAHSCGRGKDGCINPRHLSWKTRVENERDKIAHGTSNRGQKSAHAKLRDEQVRYIKNVMGKYTNVELAKAFSVSPTTIYEIRKGIRWAWMENNDG